MATLVNVSLSLVPTVVTPATMTTATSAAISPYSMAVTPDWSDRKDFDAFGETSLTVGIDDIKLQHNHAPIQVNDQDLSDRTSSA